MIKAWFLPNKILSRQSALLLVASQVVILLILWLVGDFKFFPTPTETLLATQRLWAAGVGAELFTSLMLSLQALAMATVISLGLSYLTVIPFFQPIVHFIGKLRFLSMIGLSFIFVMLTSTGFQLKASLLVFAITVFFVTSMLDVLASVPRTQYDLARTLRMSEPRLVWEVIVRGQLDKAFDVLRQNAAIGWVMLTVAEGISRSGGGIGAMLLNSSKHFHLDSILVIQVCILLLGLLQDYAIGFIKGIVCPYAQLTTIKK